MIQLFLSSLVQPYTPDETMKSIVSVLATLFTAIAFVSFLRTQDGKPSRRKRKLSKKLL